MIYITQLIYIIDGQENIFDQFEAVAIPLIGKYNGRLLFRVRPDNNSYIEHQIEKPYEIHLVEFDAEQDFQNFMRDEERKKFLHLKDKSIKASILYKGSKLWSPWSDLLIKPSKFVPNSYCDFKLCRFNHVEELNKRIK